MILIGKILLFLVIMLVIQLILFAGYFNFMGVGIYKKKTFMDEITEMGLFLLTLIIAIPITWVITHPSSIPEIFNWLLLN